jgi:pimeloyl-[acyl-carrier protein] synthase
MGRIMSGAADVDLLSEGFFANPFPTFERLRTESPVYFFKPLQCFILTRAADIDALVKNPSFSSKRARELLGSLGLIGDDEDSKKMLETWSRLTFLQDPPRHTLLRQLIMKGFSPVIVERLRPRIAAIVARALEKIRSQGEANIVMDLAEPVALNSIAELFAIPEGDRPRFMKWSNDVLKPGAASVGAEESKRAIRQSSNDMIAYLETLASERRKAPGEDLVSEFIALEGEDPELAGEAVIQSFQMVGAGFVTSMNQISNTVLALLKHPEELRKLREDSGLLKGALEECLRHEPSVLAINRLCVEDAELGGTKIPKGQFVFAMAAAANRDPAVFPDPDRFDITRARNRHLTFGIGVHYCPGAPLIRLELEESLKALLSLPRWELGDKPYDYVGSNFQDRGPSSLHVRFPAA